MLGWLIRLLIVVLVIRALWGFVSGLFEGASTPRRRVPKANVPLVRDPVCGTYLQASRALTTRSGAKVYYFCSEECQRAFDRGVGQATNEVSS